MRSIGMIHILLLIALVMSVPAASFAGVVVAVTIAPPPLPVYVQPVCPAEGYIWVPGYWAYGNDFDDYYWVPGTWVLAPEAGLLWTPPYWGWNGFEFVFYNGYWAPQVGFYGGINYGFGYFGDGYAGGRWDNGRFFYNRSVTNVNTTIIHNVYNTTVVNNTVNRISYNGGNGGISARPTAAQEAVSRERHIDAVSAQTQHVQAARADSQMRAAVNRGKPQVAATPRPGALRDRGAVPAERAGGDYRPMRMSSPEPRRGGGAMDGRPAANIPAAVHPQELPQRPRMAPPDTGNDKRDRQFQQQQDKLFAQQQQEQRKLEQKQERDHQHMEQRRADEAGKQQMERAHQQQTQRLEQRQSQQLRKLQERQRPHDQGKPPKRGGQD